MLKEIRESRGMSQQDLAAKSGINKRMIQAYEQGYRDINGAKLSTLVTFCIVLECRLSEIVEDAQLVKGLKAMERYHLIGLREATEEGCVFCNDERRRIREVFDEGYEATPCCPTQKPTAKIIDAENHYALSVDTSRDAAIFNVFYCPMCGKKLEVEPWN